MSLLTPVFTECPSCPNWQIACEDDEEKARRERTHAQGKHGGVVTSEAVAELMFDDPKNKRGREVVVECIREVAERNGRRVDSNVVRELLPSWIQPQLVGSVYSVLLRRGLLVPDGDLKSTDKRGRNGNKKLAAYRYTGALS